MALPVRTLSSTPQEHLDDHNAMHAEFSTSVKVATANRAAVDITLNSASWAAVDTGTDLTVAAAAGDQVEVSVSFLLADSGSFETFFDAVSVVSGTATNSWGTGGAQSASTEGVQAWRNKVASTQTGKGGSYIRTLVAGDISAGNVTIRLMYRQSPSGAQTLYCSANRRLHFSAKNFGAGT